MKNNKMSERLTASRCMRITSAAIAASIMLTLTACGDSSSKPDQKKTSETTTTAKAVNTMPQQQGAPDEPNQDIDDGADISKSATEEPSSAEEPKEENAATDKASSAKAADNGNVSETNTHYEDDILTFDLPQGASLDADYLTINMARCKIDPDDEYRELYISYYGEADYDESFPVDFINVASDFGESLEYFYDESISTAEIAADYCYKDYVDTGYIESDSPDYGCVGRYTMDIDGQTAYVVWHMGSGSDMMANSGPSYEIYVDSLKGTIVEIDYSESLGKGMTEKAENVISTIRFKSN